MNHFSEVTMDIGSFYQSGLGWSFGWIFTFGWSDTFGALGYVGAFVEGPLKHV
jgi:hypothetical protein